MTINTTRKQQQPEDTWQTFDLKLHVHVHAHAHVPVPVPVPVQE